VRIAILCLLTIGSSFLPAQTRHWTPLVRSIRVESVPTSPKGLPNVEFKAVMAAWKQNGVKLDVEAPLDTAAVDKAGEVLRDLYAERGQSVRVEHSISGIPPRSAEVAFRVIQLSNCK